MPVLAIILDVGGVLLHERNHAKRDMWEEQLGLARGQLNLPPKACVFVDDKRSNVDAAQRLGMQGVWYRETQPAIADIESCLSIWSAV